MTYPSTKPEWVWGRDAGAPGRIVSEANAASMPVNGAGSGCRLALGACCASAVFDATLAANAAATSAFRKSRLGLSVLDSIFVSLTNSSGSSFSISRKKIPDECRFLRFAQRGAVGNHCGDQLSIGILGIVGVVLDAVETMAGGARPLQNHLARQSDSPFGFGLKVVEQIVNKDGSFLFGELCAHRDHARNHFGILGSRGVMVRADRRCPMACVARAIQNNFTCARGQQRKSRLRPRGQDRGWDR